MSHIYVRLIIVYYVRFHLAFLLKCLIKQIMRSAQTMFTIELRRLLFLKQLVQCS